MAPLSFIIFGVVLRLLIFGQADFSLVSGFLLAASRFARAVSCCGTAKSRPGKLGVFRPFYRIGFFRVFSCKTGGNASKFLRRYARSMLLV
jgi:hypothetical protein